MYANMSGGTIAGEVRNPTMAGPFLQTRPCTMPHNRRTQDAKSLDTTLLCIHMNYVRKWLSQTLSHRTSTASASDGPTIRTDND